MELIGQLGQVKMLRKAVHNESQSKNEASPNDHAGRLGASGLPSLWDSRCTSCVGGGGGRATSYISSCSIERSTLRMEYLDPSHPSTRYLVPVSDETQLHSKVQGASRVQCLVLCAAARLCSTFLDHRRPIGVGVVHLLCQAI